MLCMSNFSCDSETSYVLPISFSRVARCSPFQEPVLTVVESGWFQKTFAVLIFTNFIINIIQNESLPPPGSSASSTFESLDAAFTAVRSRLYLKQAPHPSAFARANEDVQGRERSPSFPAFSEPMFASVSSTERLHPIRSLATGMGLGVCNRAVRQPLRPLVRALRHGPVVRLRLLHHRRSRPCRAHITPTPPPALARPSRALGRIFRRT
jgi:hypothetical protein